MSAGVDELIKIDDEAKEQMDNALYGGMDANENQQKMAEVHFEAWMRLLDSRVTTVSNFIMNNVPKFHKLGSMKRFSLKPFRVLFCNQITNFSIFYEQIDLIRGIAELTME